MRIMRRLDLMGWVYLHPLSGVYGKDLLRLPHCTSRYIVISNRKLSNFLACLKDRAAHSLKSNTAHHVTF